jgi:peroxiredoxin
MKKSLLYLLPLLLLLLAACSKPVSTAVTLTGEIKGLGDDTIYLRGADRLYDHIDTFVVKHDKFSASLQVDTLVETTLLFSNGAEYPLFLNSKEQIRIKGSADALAAIQVSGNVANEEMTRFNELLRTPATPSKQVLQEKADTFIRQHPNSVVSVYLLRKYFVNDTLPDIVRIRTLSDLLTGELKDRPQITNLLATLQLEENAGMDKVIPYFRIANKEGKEITRLDFNNQHLLIHFWASWNKESLDELAIYRRLYKKEKKNKQFALLGISLDMDKQQWRQTIKADTLEWEQASNLKGWDDETIQKFVIHSLPANILLSPTGRIEARNISEADLLTKIEQWKAEEAAREKAKKATRRK